VMKLGMPSPPVFKSQGDGNALLSNAGLIA